MKMIVLMSLLQICTVFTKSIECLGRQKVGVDNLRLFNNSVMDSLRDNLEKIPSTDDGIKKLYSIFNSIDFYSMPIIRFYIDKGTFVIRGRINLRGEDYNCISDLSYPPVGCCKEYGRANIPYHPMFYCCSFPSDYDAPIPRYITLLETSKFVKDNETIGIERITFSRWDVIDRLNLLALPFSKSYKRSIKDIQQIQKEWEKESKKGRVNKRALEIVEYMSKEIASQKEDNISYFKVAHFIYFLLYINDKTKGADGIIYPSVAADGEGFNIALKPKSVDNKLSFSKAALCYHVKDCMESTLYGVNHSIATNQNGILIYIPDDYFDFNICNGYRFIN